MKKLFLLSLLAMIAGGCALVSRNNIKCSGTTYAADVVKPYIQSGELPGIITVLAKGDVYEIHCAGWADVEKKIPITMDSMFRQCSQTKGFCGVSIAMLVEEGKISLDDPVAKYLPEFKSLKVMQGKGKNKKIVPAKNTLTIRMVMNHTGGFPFETVTKNKKGWCAASLRDSAKEAAATPLLFEPGTEVKYSNTGIDIGAAVVEVVTGKPWEVFLQERIFEPLGMTNTTFFPTEEQLATAISAYTVRKGKKATPLPVYRWMPPPYNGKTVFPSAGAGLWSSANDQLKFYRMLMNLGKGDNGVRILKEETVKTLLASSAREPKFEKYSLGLRTNGEGSIGHGGALGTKCTVDWKTKQLELIVVQLQGSPRPWNKAINQAAKKFFTAKLDTAGTDAYTGRIK